jgi:MSHA biogenesis protein MshJ
VIGFAGMYDKVRPLVERLDGFSIRERALIFSVGVAILYVAWQSLLMDPLTVRGKAAELHLADARQQMAMSEQIRAVVVHDPAVEAALHNGALAARLAALDSNLNSVAHGYVAPERMTELLRSLLSEQRGLTLVSLANLPVESLSLLSASKQAAASTPAAIAPDDRGPFLHPVEMVVEGDYGSVVVYLRALEALPWRIHWQRVELTAGDYPVNRVRIVIGALSLSRYWMTV